MSAMTNLFRHPKTHVYYFRKAVPKHLRPILGKGEVKESLSTKVLSEAKRLAHLKALEVDKMFASAGASPSPRPHQKLSDASIDQLIALLKHEFLKGDEELRNVGDNDPAFYEAIGQQPGAIDGFDEHAGVAIEVEAGLSNRGYQVLEQLIAQSQQDWKFAYAKRQTNVIRPIADEFLRDHGVTFDPESESYRRFLQAALKALVEVIEALSLRHQGEIVETPPEPRLSQTLKTADTGTGKDTLQSVFERWKIERKPQKKTAKEFGTAVRRFEELHGSITVGKVTKHMVVAFKDALLKLPARPGHQFRKMTLPEQLAHLKSSPAESMLSAAAINKQLSAVKAILGYAVDNALTETNPASGVSIKDSQSDKAKRLSYDLDDLKKISSFPIFTESERPKAGAGEAAVWLPILALYTGARVEELGQLLLRDIREEHGVHYLDIRESSDGVIKQRVKNSGSQRRVPLHADVITLGFLGYCEALKKKGEQRVFPALKARKTIDQLTASWSSWWGRYARDHGNPDKKKSFHSFRHSFKDACRQASIPSEYHDAITGHVSGSIGSKYGSAGYPLALLKEQIDKVSYPGVVFNLVKAKV